MPTNSIFIDADACPVKQEVYRVAERHALMFCGGHPYGAVVGVVPAIPNHSASS